MIQIVNLPAGTVLYRGSSYERTASIVEDGITATSSAWVDTELGPGFYLATTPQTGAGYMEKLGAVLEVTTTAPMNGLKVKPPAAFDWKGREAEMDGYVNTYDFLVNVDDVPISQYKFHYGMSTPNLQVTGVYVKDPGGTTRLNGENWKRLTADEYLRLMGLK